MKLFRKQVDQNEKLLKNIKEYEKKKAKQQESKVLGQKPVKGKRNREKSICLHYSQWCEGVYNMV